MIFRTKGGYLSGVFGVKVVHLSWRYIRPIFRRHSLTSVLESASTTGSISKGSRSTWCKVTIFCKKCTSLPMVSLSPISHSAEKPLSIWNGSSWSEQLQMKGQWESNINVWFPFLYCIPRNETVQPPFFPKPNYNVLSPSSCTHICVSETFIYFQDRFVYFAAAKYVDRSW